MKIINIALLITAAVSMLLSISSCGSKNSGESDAVYESSSETDPVDFTTGDRMMTPDQLDEFILYPDDMTSGEAVGALYYLHTRIEESTGSKKDVAMRKFIDLYGIVMDINSDNLRTAIDKLRSSKGVDLSSIYDDYRTTMQVGDETAPGADELESAQATITTVNDSTAAESASTSSQTNDPEATITTSVE